MTNKTVLSDENRDEIYKRWERLRDGASYDDLILLTELALLQSPEIQQALADSKRIDWLADPNNNIGNVQLPSEMVENNLHSLRAAIDASMEIKR